MLLLPVFMDGILAFRLYAVYPPQSTRRSVLSAIFIPLALLKLVRLVNITVFMVKFGASLLSSEPETAVGKFQVLWDHSPYPKIEWILQVFDNW
jgi:hypothetical protein